MLFFKNLIHLFGTLNTRIMLFFEFFSIEVLNSLTLLINWAVKVNFFRDRIAFLNGKESHYSDSTFLIKHCFIFKISLFHGFLKQFRVEVLSQNVCVKTIQEVTQQKCLLLESVTHTHSAVQQTPAPFTIPSYLTYTYSYKQWKQFWLNWK